MAEFVLYLPIATKKFALICHQKDSILTSCFLLKKILHGVNMKLYIASSWKNPIFDSIVTALRAAGHEVYDFKDTEYSFEWKEIDENYTKWTSKQFLDNLYSKKPLDAFDIDYEAMDTAEGCVLVLPAGCSAHLEAGYFCGANKPLFILLNEVPIAETMYLLTGFFATNIEELVKLIETSEDISKNLDLLHTIFPEGE